MIILFNCVVNIVSPNSNCIKIITRYQSGIKERLFMKSWTVRLPDDLDKQLTEYAKVEEMSKNQVVKRAIKKFLEEKKDAS